MLTLQEIQSISFDKAVFGGYDMKSVDMFVEQLTEDYAALQKENAALKSKMKVLVDKIEEYRSVEDGMRKALLSAQNIANEMVEKAKIESAQVINAAKTEAETRIGQYRVQMHDEENRLSAAKRLSEDFIAKMSAYYQSEISNLAQLSAASAVEVPQKQAVQAVEPTHGASQKEDLEKTKELAEIEVSLPDDIAAMMSAAKKSIAESPVYKPTENQDKPFENDDSMKMKVFEVTLGGTPKQSVPEQPQETQHGKFDFGNLRFGKGYSDDDDK